MNRVAVIGLGAMGSRVARRLVDAGHEVAVWNRTPEKMRPLVEWGATPTESPAAAAARADVILTMVADPPALRAVSEGPDAISAGARASATVIEMSTVGPAAVARLASALPKEVSLLDAPVLGSIGEAESGSLGIFVGGAPELFERWRPLLSELGAPILVGGLGRGAAAKLVANLTLLGTLGVLGEAIALADGLELSRGAALEVLALTPLAAQAERRRAVIDGSVDLPTRFALMLARKDAELIVDAATGAKVDLRVTAAMKSWLADAEREIGGDRDYSAVLAHMLERGV